MGSDQDRGGIYSPILVTVRLKNQNTGPNETKQGGQEVLGDLEGTGQEGRAPHLTPGDMEKPHSHLPPPQLITEGQVPRTVSPLTVCISATPSSNLCVS
jgi:hypothetical protein